MSGSAALFKRLKDPESVTVNGGGYMESWSNSYMINGAHRECHPDFIATPIGESPYGFLVCQRKKSEAYNFPRGEVVTNNNQIKFGHDENESHYSQSYNLYNSTPSSHPRVISQPRRLADRRLPNQATLQGSDYFRTPIIYDGIGSDNLDRLPGQFGYRENKYYFSAPPPLFDITHAVQPYPLWRREQLRLGTANEEQMQEFEKKHTYSLYNAAF